MRKLLALAGSILIILAILSFSQLFANPSSTYPTPTPTQPPSSPDTRCKVTGCSGQLCSEEDLITTCEYRAEYTCYKDAECERQADGKCGWKQTDQLLACLKKASVEQPDMKFDAPQ